MSLTRDRGRFWQLVRLGAVFFVATVVDQARSEVAATPSARVGAFFFDGWSGQLGNFSTGPACSATPYSGRRPLSGPATDDRARGDRGSAPLGARHRHLVLRLRLAPRARPGATGRSTRHSRRTGSSLTTPACGLRSPTSTRIPFRDTEREMGRRHRALGEGLPHQAGLRCASTGDRSLIILEERHFILQWGGAAGANRAIATLRAAAQASRPPRRLRRRRPLPRLVQRALLPAVSRTRIRASVRRLRCDHRVLVPTHSRAQAGTPAVCGVAARSIERGRGSRSRARIRTSRGDGRLRPEADDPRRADQPRGRPLAAPRWPRDVVGDETG